MGTVPTLAIARRFAADGTARRIRVAARLSIYDIAADVGVQGGTISRWETGKRVPRGEPAIRYAEVLSQLLEIEATR